MGLDEINQVEEGYLSKIQVLNQPSTDSMKVEMV
jgi:hypothetical protein